MKPVHCSWVDMQVIGESFDGVVSVRDWKLLPNVSAVYLAFYDEAPLYAGQTQKLNSRWKTHGIRRLISTLPGVAIGYRLTNCDRLFHRKKLLIHEFRPLLQKNSCLRHFSDSIIDSLRERIVYLNGIRQRKAGAL